MEEAQVRKFGVSVIDKYEFNQSQKSPRLSFLAYKIRVTDIYLINHEDQTNVIQTFHEYTLIAAPGLIPLGWMHLSIFNLAKGWPLHNRNCIHSEDLLGRERPAAS